MSPAPSQHANPQSQISPNQSISQHSTYSPSFTNNNASNSDSHILRDVVFNATPVTIVSPYESVNNTTPTESVSTKSTSESTSPPDIPHCIHPQNTHSMNTRGRQRRDWLDPKKDQP
jgi:hypothetical protein